MAWSKRQCGNNAQETNEELEVSASTTIAPTPSLNTRTSSVGDIERTHLTAEMDTGFDFPPSPWAPGIKGEAPKAPDTPDAPNKPKVSKIRYDVQRVSYGVVFVR